MLPYKGIGSGIRRALDDWRKIEFRDDRGGCLFTVTVQRSTEKSTGKVAGKRALQQEIVERFGEKFGENIGTAYRYAGYDYSPTGKGTQVKQFQAVHESEEKY